MAKRARCRASIHRSVCLIGSSCFRGITITRVILTLQRAWDRPGSGQLLAKFGRRFRIPKLICFNSYHTWISSFWKRAHRSYTQQSCFLPFILISEEKTGASLVGQWLRIHFSAQQTWVQSLVGEQDLTCWKHLSQSATTPEPVHHD